MKQSLEDKLEALHGPAMPPDVEARILKRLRAGADGRNARPARGARRKRPVLQWAILAVLLLTSAWVFQISVMPALRSAWERAHCITDPAKGK